MPYPDPDPWPVDTVTTYPLALSRRGDGTLTRAAGPPTEEQQALRDHMAAREKQAIARAGKALAEGLATCADMTPREQAEAAWTPTSRHSVDELEDLIRLDRGMEPLDRKGGGRHG